MIKDNKLNKGDLVVSTVAGKYQGIKGEVLRLTENDENNQTNVVKTYDIQLETGEVISMKTSELELVKQ